MRDLLSKYPWLGWAIAGLLFALTLWLIFRPRNAGEYDPDRMKDMLTIRYTDTDEVEKIPRGRLDQMLRRSGDNLDPTKGIINPKTGKPTGFLVDEDEWSSMIERINREKSQIRHESGAKSRVLPRKETPLTPEQLKKLEDDAKKTAPAGK